MAMGRDIIATRKEYIKMPEQPDKEALLATTQALQNIAAGLGSVAHNVMTLNASIEILSTKLDSLIARLDKQS